MWFHDNQTTQDWANLVLGTHVVLLSRPQLAPTRLCPSLDYITKTLHLFPSVTTAGGSVGNAVPSLLVKVGSSLYIPQT